MRRFAGLNVFFTGRSGVGVSCLTVLGTKLARLLLLNVFNNIEELLHSGLRSMRGLRSSKELIQCGSVLPVLDDLLQSI